MMPYYTDIDQFCAKFIHVIAMKKLLEVIFRKKKNRLRAFFFQMVHHSWKWGPSPPF